jgi:hypothetical protein
MSIGPGSVPALGVAPAFSANTTYRP